MNVSENLRRIVGAGLTAFLTASALAAALASPAQGGALETDRICATTISEVEPQWRIPDKLLFAISVVESGRWNSEAEQNFAWPWTVMAEGKGRYFKSKSAAIDAIKELQARGISNIDVSCMQINLRYHPGAFSNLNEAFDPAINVACAAAFLSDLRTAQKSWTQAVKHYHSSTPALQAPYRSKVYAAWREIRRLDNEAIRASRKVALAERKLQRKKNALLAKYVRSNGGDVLPAAAAADNPKFAHIDLATWPHRTVKKQRRAEVRASARAYSTSGF